MLCIVVALVWKIWAARLAPGLVERARRMHGRELDDGTSDLVGCDADAADPNRE